MSPALHSFRNNHIITFIKKISSTENYPPPRVFYMRMCNAAIQERSTKIQHFKEDDCQSISPY